MATTHWAWVGLVGAMVLAGCSGKTDVNGGAGVEGVADDAKDVLAEVQKINGPDAPKPPTDWRTGHAKPRKLAANAITTSDSGFVIQLPSKAPVPTPTLYEGRLYVGGGFHSKEFYCFDATTGALVWGVDVDDDGPSSAVVDDGVVVFNTESCTIFALDAKTGKHLWSWWLGDPLASTPTIANGRVYTSYPAGGRGGGQFQPQLNNAQLDNVAPNQNDQQVQSNDPPTFQVGPDAANAERPAASHVLACFELKTGKVLWQKWIDSEVMSAPVAVDDELYVATFGGTLYTFNAPDGTIKAAKRSRVTSAPVVVGGDLYFTCRVDGHGQNAREAIALNDRATQSAKSRFNDRDALWLDASVQSGGKFAAESQQLDAGNGFASAPQTLNAQAAADNVGYANVSSLQAFQGSRIAHMNGRTYNTMGDELFCIDPSSGETVWSSKLAGDLKKEGGFLGTAPAAVHDEIVMGTLGGQIVRIDAATGKHKQRYDVGAPVRFQPVVMDGRIYVGTQNGKVVCIDTGDRELTGWSAWGGNMQHTGAAH